MDEKSATEIVKNYEAKVPSLLAQKAKTLVETNPIADWMDNFIIVDPTARTNVGVAKRDKDNSSPFWYLNTEEWLYPNYCEYCHNSGTKAVSLRRFVNLLSDLGKNQLGLDIHKERDRTGSYFVGLKIRTDQDESPPSVTGNTSVAINVEESPSVKENTSVTTNVESPPNNTNVFEKVCQMMMSKVMDVMNKVMAQTIEDDDCDNCDGKNEKSDKIKEPVKTPACCNTEKSSSTESKPSQTEQEIKEELPAIAVGDRVVVDDCPGHWAWGATRLV